MTKWEWMTPEEYIAKLEKENKELNEKYNWLWKIYTADVKERVEENKKLREELSAYDREYFDEDKKAEYIFMEEDTLQELKDIWELGDDELIYEEWLYD